MARPRPSRSGDELRCACVGIVASTALIFATALPACNRTPNCPSRDGPELLDSIDPSWQPHPRLTEVAKEWVSMTGVDPALVQGIAVALTEHARSVRFWELLLRVAPAYTQVTETVAARGLPLELAALPLALSGYDGGAVGADCRRGQWLLPPTDPSARVAGCHLRGSAETWSPPVEPEGGLVLAGGACRIVDCAVDDRGSLAASTQAALHALEARWRALPRDEHRLSVIVAEASGKDPALVFAWHLLATCFYADADAPWSARWKPAPAWCAEVLAQRPSEVEACLAQPDAPAKY